MCETPEIEIPTWRAPFGFEIGKIVKYASLNSDQLDLILRKTSRVCSSSSPNRPPRNHGHHANLTTKNPDAHRRLVPRKWIGLSVTRGNEISAEEMRTRNKSKLMPGTRDALRSRV